MNRVLKSERNLLKKSVAMACSVLTKICAVLGLFAVVQARGHASPPESYYAGTENKNGAQLLDALHAIVGPHNVVGYDQLWEAYGKTDVNAEGKPWCIYSEFPFTSFKSNPAAQPGRIGSFLTREHSFPKDWWGGARNAAYSDLFHVIPGDAHVNGQKGVNPLGEVDEDGVTFGVSLVGRARDDLGYQGEVFEPADGYKGDFARNYLYFATAYLAGPGPLDCARSPMIAGDGVSFKPWARRLLLKWNREDPVSERERLRNEAVFALQGNRNPFIDHPEFADRIWEAEEADGFWVGIDASYALEMERKGVVWQSGDATGEIFRIFGAAGVNRMRVRLWTSDEGVNGLHYATEMARRAQEQGIKPLLVVFLSENWADYVKQPVPTVWKELSFEDKLKAVEAYAERVARHFADSGVIVKDFEIGNEIDFGLCGEFEEEWSRRVSTEYMRSTIWLRVARLVRAAQAGIRRVSPDAKFVLHLTQWWNPSYCGAFFKTMLGAGVEVDFAGLSFFPTSDLSKENSFGFFLKQTEELYRGVRRPLVICEYAYPSEPKFTGQFSAWNQPVNGYALDAGGQAAWVRDFLRQLRATGYFDGAFYWSPEWYESDMWSAFALFDGQGRAKPALSEFAAEAGRR